MLFRRLVMNAVVVGFIAGFVLSIVQILTVNPIIVAAESFEQAEPAGVVTGQHEQTPATGGHHHSADAWAPKDGIERLLSTLVANVMAGIGFAALVLALMSQLQIQGIATVSVPKGLAWGIAGFLAFFLAPGIGMPPEIPGAVSAPIASRQLWWVLVVVGVSIGLLVLAYAPVKWKAFGLLSIAAPYLVSIPHYDGPMFTHPDPDAVNALTGLHQQFFMVSGMSNFVFWLVLGTASAWVLNRWVLAGLHTPTNSTQRPL